MSVDLIRNLYGYHWWANRRLFEVASALGEDAVGRDVGTQFSFPTLRGMFAHLYGADLVWLQRWRGALDATLPSAQEFPTLAALRARWDPFEKDQRAFVDGLRPEDLDRAVRYTSRFLEGTFHTSLGALMMHVANHATHHRSEIATMLTMLGGSPPPSDLVIYELARTGQRLA